MAKKKIWATTGRTESGDDLEILLWDHKPTDKEVDAYYRESLPEEYEEVGFVNHQTEIATVMWKNG